MTDDTAKSIIDSITVKYPKLTRIPSGHFCTVVYECIHLSGSDVARLAAEATGHLDGDAFDVAVGVAFSGVLFAAAVAGGRHVAILQPDGEIYGPSLKGKKVVVVDDVVCTGRRLSESADAVVKAGGKVVGYACIIDRSNGKVGTAQLPLWSAHQTLLV